MAIFKIPDSWFTPLSCCHDDDNDDDTDDSVTWQPCWDVTGGCSCWYELNLPLQLAEINKKWFYGLGSGKISLYQENL